MGMGHLAHDQCTRASIWNVMIFSRIDVTNVKARIAIARISSMCKDEWSFSLLTLIVWIHCIWLIVVIGVVIANAYGTLFFGDKQYPLDSHHHSALQNYSSMTLADAKGHPNIVPNSYSLVLNIAPRLQYKWKSRCCTSWQPQSSYYLVADGVISYTHNTINP